MIAEKELNITNFLEGAPRYRIAIDTSDEVDDSFVNVGEELAQFIANNPEMARNQLEFAIVDELARLFRENAKVHHVWRKYICITNLAILFEPALGINILQQLQSISRTTLVIMRWEGEYDTNNLYFLTQADGLKIDLSQTNHIFI